MKTNSISKLAGLAIGISSLLGTGCTSIPRAVKVALTPVAIVRDIVDIPLTVTANGIYSLSNHSGQRDMFNYHGLKSGEKFSINQFGVEATSDLFGGLDYLLCRSLIPFPEGTTLWKEDSSTWREYLFPNTHAIWAPTAEDAFTGKKYLIK